jgi:hypothetical protein
VGDMSAGVREGDVARVPGPRAAKRSNTRTDPPVTLLGKAWRSGMPLASPPRICQVRRALPRVTPLPKSDSYMGNDS